MPTASYSAGLYMRLSRDDDVEGESSSIINQRTMLYAFAKEHNFNVYNEYVDDGFSGTNFERPGFSRLIKDIESGYVNLVITKDLSRLGRDYIISGHYIETYFPENNVRYIAINDGYDSDASGSGISDITPFKNIVNEMYARTTSKSIRSAVYAKMDDGQFIGNFAPYGYKKDPENKNHLIVDDNVAWVVKKIFKLAEGGWNPSSIADYLNSERIMCPVEYRCSSRPHLDINNYSKVKQWTSNTVNYILRNIVYLGHIAQGKTTKCSFKSKKAITNPKSKWKVKQNKHEPLVTQDQFDIVQILKKSKATHKDKGFKNVFSGIAKCADCGKNMSTTGTRKKGSVANLVCGGYKLRGKKGGCTNHFIDYETLYNLILNELRRQINITDDEKKEVIEQVRSEKKSLNNAELIKLQLNELEKRSRELDNIIKKLYEDNFSGKISDERFEKLMKDYDAEQNNINMRIKDIKERDINNKEELMNYEKYFELLQSLTDINELTPGLLIKLIDHIEISQGYYEKTQNGEVKHQSIKIFYKFIKEGQEIRTSIA